jgi:ferredoxin
LIESPKIKMIRREKSAFFKVNEKCNGCLSCVQNCPANALSFEDRGKKRTLKHNMSMCARCGNCWRICPQGAIEFQHLLKGDWDDVVTMELVHCEVCGEPLYTVNFEETLNGKLKHGVENLCPEHRKGLPITAWKRLKAGTDKIREAAT